MADTKNTTRRYISDNYNNKKVFLVYKHKKNIVSSEGPFTNLNDAEAMVRDLLIDGVCAWMVSYNETER